MKRNSISLVIACLISLSCLAEEEQDIFAVTSENCGEMTLDECADFMVWAKAESERVDQGIRQKRNNIRRMHEEALEVLGEEENNTQ